MGSSMVRHSKSCHIYIQRSRFKLDRYHCRYLAFAFFYDNNAWVYSKNLNSVTWPALYLSMHV